MNGHAHEEQCVLNAGCSKALDSTADDAENSTPCCSTSKNGTSSSKPLSSISQRHLESQQFLDVSSIRHDFQPGISRSPTNVPLPMLKPLPNSPIFYYFCGKCHVASLSKIISLIYLPIYGFLIALLLLVGNAMTIMFAALFLGSVAYSTIYGAFRGSKLCLLPFLFLQVMLIFYAVFLLLVLIYAMLNQEGFVFNVLKTENAPFGFTTAHVVIVLISFLLAVLGPLVISVHIIYLDYVFISELDEVLDMMKEFNENMSKDDPSPPHF